jgi:hypothetical protein
MDAASSFRLVQFACFAVLSCGTVVSGQDPNPRNACCQETQGVHRPGSNPIQSVVHWVERWVMRGSPVLLRVAGYLETNRETKPSAAPWGTKTHVGDNGTDRNEKGSEVPPSDAVLQQESIAPADSEPIIEMPVAPPLPTNYHFTFPSLPQTESPHRDAMWRSIAVSFALDPTQAAAV